MAQIQRSLLLVFNSRDGGASVHNALGSGGLAFGFGRAGLLRNAQEPRRFLDRNELAQNFLILNLNLILLHLRFNVVDFLFVPRLVAMCRVRVEGYFLGRDLFEPPLVRIHVPLVVNAVDDSFTRVCVKHFGSLG